MRLREFRKLEFLNISDNKLKRYITILLETMDDKELEDLLLKGEELWFKARILSILEKRGRMGTLLKQDIERINNKAIQHDYSV